MKRPAVLVSLVACAHLVVISTPAFAQPAGEPAGAASSAPASGAPASGAPAKEDLVAKGQQLFDDQQYEESIQTLSAALLRPDSTKAQKIEVYRLLALNYITLGRDAEAESAVRGLLVIDPSYRLPETESPRFRDFFAKARAKWEEEGRPGLVREKPKEAPVTLTHGAPSEAEPDHTVALQAHLEDPGQRAASVRLYYRAGSRGDFVEAPATMARAGKGARVQASIPASAVKPPLVEYYFTALDAEGHAVASRGDATSPLRIAVPEPSSGWTLPLAIGGGILGAAAIFGGLALAGVFKGASGGGPAGGGPGTSVVSVSVGTAGR